jgi:hypothetical protein
MQLLGDLDTLSFVRISQLNWTGHVNRMDSTRTASQVFNNNPWGESTKRTTRNQVVELYQTNINGCNIKPGKGGQKTEVTGRGPLRKQGATMDYSTI